MTTKAFRPTAAVDLQALIADATNEELRDGGRYFAESCDDLTRCRHEEIGEYQRSADGELVEWLWNHRQAILKMLDDRGSNPDAQDRLAAIFPDMPADAIVMGVEAVKGALSLQMTEDTAKRYSDMAAILRAVPAEALREAGYLDRAADMLAELALPRPRAAVGEREAQWTASLNEVAKIILRMIEQGSCADLWASDMLPALRRLALQSPPAKVEPTTLALVIAAREFWDAHNDLSPESKALDTALEPFAATVPYANEPAVDATTPD